VARLTGGGSRIGGGSWNAAAESNVATECRTSRARIEGPAAIDEVPHDD
jgi:hypothetical protein